MERYQYTALPPLLPEGRTPPYTRLVRLFPGRGNDPILCTLFIVGLLQAPVYETISYVWGASTGTMEPHVVCDGRAVSITPNLDRALRWLRYANQERLLWIDAICIDQNNLEERSRQVGYMRLVYKYAQRVLICLGPRTPGIEQAFELARRMPILKNLPQMQNPASVPELLGMTDDEFEIATFYLSELFECDYFSRIWCVQEVVASKLCLAKCEDLEMDFMDLISTAPYIFERRNQVKPDKPLGFWNGIPLSRTRSSVNGVEGSLGPLLTLLAGTRDFKATDPRDKVFALLGISDEGLEPVLALTQIMGKNHSLGLRITRKVFKGLAEFVNSAAPQGSREFGRPRPLVPDYTKNIREVYRDLTRFFLRASPRVLTVLSHVQHTGKPDDDFPSWVPKWQEPRTVSIFSVGMFLAGFCDGHFRYFANIQDNPYTGKAVEPDKLRIDGFKIDQVVRVTDVMSFGLHDEWPAETIWRQLFNFPLFSSSETEKMPVYRNGDRLDVAFCLAASASPLGTVAWSMMSDPAKIEGIQRIGDEGLPQLRASARADAAAFILANTPRDTTSLPEYLGLHADASQGNLADFHRVAKIFTHNRRFYLTKSGYIGIGPMVIQPGDEVCVLFGGRPVFVVRPMTDHYLFIGDSYIMDEGIMWGKATEQVKRGAAGANRVVTFELR